MGGVAKVFVNCPWMLVAQEKKSFHISVNPSIVTEGSFTSDEKRRQELLHH